MKLGSSARIAVSTKDIAASSTFYKKMGFSPVGDQTPHITTDMSFLRLTDGQIILTLLKEDFPSPVLAYFAEDLTEIGSHVKQHVPDAKLINDEEGKLREIVIDAPEGVTIDIHRDTKNYALKASGEVNPKCGKFGEFAISVKDHDNALAFWKPLGFDKVSSHKEPRPWSILQDDNIVVGLHQGEEFQSVLLTYFAPDGPAKIKALRDEGIVPVTEFPAPDGIVSNVIYRAPEGTTLAIFTWDF